SLDLEEMDQAFLWGTALRGYQRGYRRSVHGSFGSEETFSEIAKERVQPAQGALRDCRQVRSDAGESNPATRASSGSRSATVAGLHAGADVSHHRAVRPLYRRVLETLALTGLRAGELLALRWKDCDFKNCRFTISNTVWRGELQTTKT